MNFLKQISRDLGDEFIKLAHHLEGSGQKDLAAELGERLMALVKSGNVSDETVKPIIDEMSAKGGKNNDET